MNANTIVDALKLAGIASDTPLTLTNPGGNNPWIFSAPAGFAANAGAPVALEVPCVPGEAVDVSGRAGIADSNGMWYADSRAFLVRAIGRIAPNAYSKTLKLYLFAGNGLNTPAAGALQDNQIGFATVTLPAQATNDAYSNFLLEAKCLWDSASLTLNGVFSGLIAGSLISATAFSVYNPSAWAAQQAPGSYNPLPFVVGANVNSTAVGGNDVVQLSEFSADAL